MLRLLCWVVLGALLVAVRDDSYGVRKAMFRSGDVAEWFVKISWFEWMCWMSRAQRDLLLWHEIWRWCEIWVSAATFQPMAWVRATACIVRGDEAREREGEFYGTYAICASMQSLQEKPPMQDFGCQTVFRLGGMASNSDMRLMKLCQLQCVRNNRIFATIAQNWYC